MEWNPESSIREQGHLPQRAAVANRKAGSKRPAPKAFANLRCDGNYDGHPPEPPRAGSLTSGEAILHYSNTPATLRRCCSDHRLHSRGIQMLKQMRYISGTSSILGGLNYRYAKINDQISSSFVLRAWQRSARRKPTSGRGNRPAEPVVFGYNGDAGAFGVGTRLGV